jgi:hypothetical protein
LSSVSSTYESDSTTIARPRACSGKPTRFRRLNLLEKSHAAPLKSVDICSCFVPYVKRGILEC